MRELVLSYYVSVDGRSADADNGMRAVMDAMDDPEQERDYVEQLGRAGAFLMGRTSWEAMAGFWPTSDHPSAPAMNRIPKVVFSRTLESAAAWPETRIASGDAAEEIAALKAEDGGPLVALAGNTFQRSLVELGVVDEYQLWVLPAISGCGTALVPPLAVPQRLRLLSSRAFGSGILELRYAPAR